MPTLQPFAPKPHRPRPPMATTYKCTSTVARGFATSTCVWINLRSGIYHYEMRYWHGTTREGEFSTEHEAIKAGYRAARR